MTDADKDRVVWGCRAAGVPRRILQTGVSFLGKPGYIYDCNGVIEKKNIEGSWFNDSLGPADSSRGEWVFLRIAGDALGAYWKCI